MNYFKLFLILFFINSCANKRVIKQINNQKEEVIGARIEIKTIKTKTKQLKEDIKTQCPKLENKIIDIEYNIDNLDNKLNNIQNQTYLIENEYTTEKYILLDKIKNRDIIIISLFSILILILKSKIFKLFSIIKKLF